MAGSLSQAVRRRIAGAPKRDPRLDQLRPKLGIAELFKRMRRIEALLIAQHAALSRGQPSQAQPPPDLPLVFSVVEAGRLVGLSRTAAYAAVKRGDLPSIRIHGKIVVPRAALLKLLTPDNTNLTEATP